jgi:hypothetical protein
MYNWCAVSTDSSSIGNNDLRNAKKRQHFDTDIILYILYICNNYAKIIIVINTLQRILHTHTHTLWLYLYSRFTIHNMTLCTYTIWYQSYAMRYRYFFLLPFFALQLLLSSSTCESQLHAVDASVVAGNKTRTDTLSLTTIWQTIEWVWFFRRYCRRFRHPPRLRPYIYIIYCTLYTSCVYGIRKSFDHFLQKKIYYHLSTNVWRKASVLYYVYVSFYERTRNIIYIYIGSTIITRRM